MGKVIDVGTSIPRIKRMLSRFFEYRPSLCIERARIYTEVFKETEGEPVIIRRAKAFKRYCQKKTVVIPSDELIVGSAASKPRAAIFCPEHAASWLRDELDELSTRHQDPYDITDAQKETLRSEIFPYWAKQNH